MEEHATTWVGVDLGDRYSYLCVLDDDGNIVEETPGGCRGDAQLAPHSGRGRRLELVD